MKMSNFTFSEADHVYRLDNLELVSVTTIIKPLSDYSMIPYAILEAARQWGNNVHLMVKLHLEDDLDEDTLDEPLRMPMEALRQWEADYPSIISGIGHIERPGYHKKLLYAGTPDLCGDTVIDVKSRVVNRLCDPLQTLLYDHMTGDGKRDHYILELRVDGKYVFTPVNQTKKERERNWSRARYLLDFHRMQSEIKLWGK